MPSESSPRTGGCECGKIKYQLTGKAATPHYNTICHCLTCRRVTGAPMLAASICPKDGFSITQGEEHLTRYDDPDTDSGKPLTRTFCGTCGSKLFAFAPLWDEIVSVAAGTLDDFESWQPTKEQYCVYRAHFLEKVKGVEAGQRFVRGARGEAEKE